LLPKGRTLSNNYPRIAFFGSLLVLLAAPSLGQNLSGPPAGTMPAAPEPAPSAAGATAPDAPAQAGRGHHHRHGHGAPASAPPPGATPAATPPGAPPPNPPPGAAIQADSGPADGVAAIVNDAIITEYDLRQRILLFVSTSGMQATPEIMAKLRGQVLTQLETEQLQIQEARRKSITVSPTDVDKSIERITTDNHLTKEQLADLLAKGGVNMATLRAQIAVQIAWQKAVSDEFQDRVNITPADVDAELAHIQEGADKPHFLLSSIFLAVDNPEMDAKVLKDAQDIYAQLQSGAQFGTVARQFSQSPTAAAGGDMGWVHQGQLSTELDAALRTMQAGSVSQPIRSTGGYYILGLRERQEGLGTHIPDPATVKPVGPLTVVRLLLPIGPKPAKPLYDNVMKIATQIHDHVNGCETLPKMAEQVHGLIYQDLAKMGLKITDLSPEIQAAINKAGPGEATPPFSSPAGVEMMVRCDKRAPTITAFTVPTRQQIEESLFDQQITMLSRRYLRDLKRNANVEVK
jgi:peptidyl-prolyl cis-trans isomerase SurA